jgi:hypothetical protein
MDGGIMAAQGNSNGDFAQEVRDAWDQAEEADKTNRKEALEDLKFRIRHALE